MFSAMPSSAPSASNRSCSPAPSRAAAAEAEVADGVGAGALDELLRNHGLEAYASALRAHGLHGLLQMSEDDMIDLYVEAGLKAADRHRFRAALEQEKQRLAETAAE